MRIHTEFQYFFDADLHPLSHVVQLPLYSRKRSLGQMMTLLVRCQAFVRLD